MSRTLYLSRMRRMLTVEGDDLRDALSSRRGWKPREVEIRLTWACDANCVMCGLRSYRGATDADYARAIPRERLFRVLAEIRALGGESVLYSGGEVTLLEDLPDILRRTADLGLMPHINTHGGRLTPAYCDRLLDAGLRGLMVSLDAPQAQMHDAIRGLPGVYDMAVGGLRYLHHKLSGRRDVHVLVNTVIMSTNYRMLPQMVVLASDLGVQDINFSPLSVDNAWDDWATGKSELNLTTNAESELAESVFPEVLNAARSRGVRVSLPAEVAPDGSVRVRPRLFNDRPVMCSVVHYHAVINVNGNVIPCCYASARSHSVGNVMSSDFAGVWHGKAFARFRDLCFPAQFEMCRSCSQHRNENELIEKWYTRSREQSGTSA